LNERGIDLYNFFTQQRAGIAATLLATTLSACGGGGSSGSSANLPRFSTAPVTQNTLIGTQIGNTQQFDIGTRASVITFDQRRNGDLTWTIDGKSYLLSYDPQTEQYSSADGGSSAFAMFIEKGDVDLVFADLTDPALDNPGGYFPVGTRTSQAELDELGGTARYRSIENRGLGARGDGQLLQASVVVDMTVDFGTRGVEGTFQGNVDRLDVDDDFQGFNASLTGAINEQFQSTLLADGSFSDPATTSLPFDRSSAIQDTENMSYAINGQLYTSDGGIVGGTIVGVGTGEDGEATGLQAGFVAPKIE